MVYVLELENGKWYVGFTRSKSRRIKDHFDGYGSHWTKKHRPVRLVEKIRGGRNVEREKTLEYMERYGIENVRGYIWCNAGPLKLPLPLVKMGDEARRAEEGLGASAEQPYVGHEATYVWIDDEL